MAAADLGQHEAFELIDIAAAACNVDQLATGLFERLERSIGFDSAAVASLRGDDWVPFRKSAQMIALCQQSSAQIKRDTLLVEERSRRAHGVLSDTEAYTALQRDRLHLFANFLRPCGVTSVVAVFLACGGVADMFVSLSRYGGKPFAEADLALLRALQPTLSVTLQRAGTQPRVGSPAPHQELTPRERELVAFAGRGLYNYEIAALFGTSALTVRNQLSKLYRKLEVSNRAELVARAAELGLLLA